MPAHNANMSKAPGSLADGATTPDALQRQSTPVLSSPAGGELSCGEKGTYVGGRISLNLTLRRPLPDVSHHDLDILRSIIETSPHSLELSPIGSGQVDRTHLEQKFRSRAVSVRLERDHKGGHCVLIP